MARILFALVIVFGALGSLSTPAPAQGPSNPPACCDLVEAALRDSQNIKVGMTRGELEELFQPGGGLQSSEKSSYDYRKCLLIHIDVEFKLDPAVDRPSPNDKVKSVSTPYIGLGISG
jgi:hypothetical protein